MTPAPKLFSRVADQVERIPVKRLMKDADPAVNYELHGGEEIRVPEAGKIFVVGNVHKPGAFPVRDAADKSVLQMVALSEGLLPFAAKMAYIYRRDGTGAKTGDSRRARKDHAAESARRCPRSGRPALHSRQQDQARRR